MASSPPPSPGPPPRPMSAMMRGPRSNSRLSNTSKMGGSRAVEDEHNKTSVKVAVRVRPPLMATDPGFDLIPQRFQRSILQVASPTTMTIDSPQGRRLFVFDKVFGEDVEQEGIWEYLVDSVSSFIQGYNVSMLAYGQSGAGKSYTMGTAGSSDQSDMDVMGVIPRAAAALFETLDGPKPSASSNRNSMTGLRTPTRYSVQPASVVRTEKTWTLKATYVEIYNEQLRDLLVPESIPMSERGQVAIREDTKGHIIMTGLHQVEINSVEDLLSALNFGSAIRQTDSTNINAKSSRSHAVFSLNLVQRKPKAMPTPSDRLQSMTLDSMNGVDAWSTFDSKLHFVDLAGSERLKNTGAEGARAKEGISINAGLASLGKVISQLSSRHAGSHVSYRDSKLTRLLQDSLGGNAITYMIACVTPAEFHLSETLNTVQYAQRARAIQSRPQIQQVTDESDKLVLIDRLKAEVTSLREQLRNTERGSHRAHTDNERPERQNMREIDLENQLIDNKQSYNSLSARHAKLIAEMSRAREEETSQVQAREGTLGVKATERLQRSTSFADAVEQVVLEYEKTIQTLEATLSGTRTQLSTVESSLQEKEIRSAYAETINQQLQARLQKMIDRESSTENYLQDLETKLDGITSGEEKSSAVITELRKEITRVRENEASCEDYISTLEERLAEADQDNDTMQREIERLEHVIERQRSIGKLDNLLYELDHIQQGPKSVEGGPVVAMHSDGFNNAKDPWAHSRKQSLANRRGRDIILENGQGEYEAEQAERCERTPSAGHSEAEGPIEDGADIEVESPISTGSLVKPAEHEYPPQSPAQSKFVQDKLENVTQELFDLRVEHESTVNEYDMLSAKYGEALRTLAELQDVVDESRHPVTRDSLTSSSTRPASFLADARVNELKSYGGQYSPSRSLSSELSSAGESTTTLEISDADAAIKTVTDHDYEDEILAVEVKNLKKMAVDKDVAQRELADRYERLEKQHKQSLDIVERLKAEVARPRSRNGDLFNGPPRTTSPVIRRKSSQSVLMVDKAHRSFASLRNIATENFENQPDVMQFFELNLNAAIHELHSRSERVQELEADIASVKKEMETKMAIISGLTRERSSIRNSSPMDLSLVASMREQLLKSETQIKLLQESSAAREQELQIEIETLQATIAAYSHQAATVKVKEQRLTMTTQDKEIAELQDQLATWEEKHHKALSAMQVSEKQLLATIAEMATRVVAPPPGNPTIMVQDEGYSSRDMDPADELLFVKQQELIANFQHELEAHRIAVMTNANRVAELEAAHADTRAQLDEAVSAREVSSAALDQHRAEIQVHKDIASTLERQMAAQEQAIKSHEDSLAGLHANHQKQIAEIRSTMSADHETTIVELNSQHEKHTSQLQKAVEEANNLLAQIAREIQSATGYAVEMDMLEPTIAELAADQRALVSMQGKNGQLENDLVDMSTANDKLAQELQEAKADHEGLSTEISARATLKAEHSSMADELSSLKKEMAQLEIANKKHSRLVEELEEQLNSNFDQHQAANNRLSSLQTERNALLEEANTSQSIILTELESVKEAYAHLQNEFQRVSPLDEFGNKRSLSVTRASIIHKNASATSLLPQTGPPNMPLPAIPGGSISHATKNSLNSIIKSPTSQTFPSGTRSPSPPSKDRPSSSDIKLAEARMKCEDQEARIRTIEKHLFAEKQLTSTLEEALTDLERQSNKVKSDCDAWRKRASDLETDLKAVKEREKERDENNEKDRYSMQAVEEEKRKRRDAEAARAHLEERMNAINKKKKKGALNCF